MLQAASLCSSEIPSATPWRRGVPRLIADALGGDAILLHKRVVARGNFRGDRFAGATGISAAKWPSSSRLAYLEWTLRPPDEDGLLHSPGQGAQSLLKHVWENC